jgi:heme exporter protein D
MEKLTEVLAMGGYAAFVWPSYAFALVVLAGLALASRRQLTRTEARLRELEAAKPDET